MPLLEPTLPSQRIPKPRKKRRTRRTINGPKVFLHVAGVVSVITGYILINVYLDRTAAGNPPQGEWGVIGMGLIGFPILCVANSVRWPKPDWRRFRR